MTTTTGGDRPVILVSNDDGIHAEGILALEEAMATVGEAYVVAPETEQSSTSHAITLSRPLRLREMGTRRWAVDGTPVDCVYVALHHGSILPRRPAVVVSGINHGPNLGTDVFYSGTVAAAREGALRGIPAMAFSMPGRGDFRVAAAAAAAMVARLLAEVARRPTLAVPLFNVNFPRGEARGVRSTVLGSREYDDLVEIRKDPRGRQYLWIGGPNVNHPVVPGSDTEAYDAGFASVTPLRMDLVAGEMTALAGLVAGVQG